MFIRSTSFFKHFYNCPLISKKLIALRNVSSFGSPNSQVNESNGIDKSAGDEFDGQPNIFNQKIIVEGVDVPSPWKSAFEFEWPEKIKDYLIRKNIHKPTPIQAQCWPIALSQRDLVGIAQTGSGKTLAYALPCLVNIDKIVSKGKKYNGPKAIILVPTRELAQQIDQVFVEISWHIPLCIYGGAARRVQKESLASRRPEILVSTPGRLNDLIDEKDVDLSDCSYLVLDEADRMLDLGFEAQMRRIVDRTPKPPYHRQTLLCSATWPKEVRDLSLDLLNNFIQVNVGSTKLIANPNIKQHVILIEPVPNDKASKLLKLVEQLDDGSKHLPNQKVLIFVSTKKGADYLQRYLNAHGFYSMAIHSDRAQQSRSQIIDAFREGKRSILIGTDIASRGLDIDDITVVINYDMPNTIEDYVHRIGRTARSDKKGTSYAFFAPEDYRLAKDLIDLLKNSNQIVDDQLYFYARQVSSERQRRDKMGYPRYSTTSNKNPTYPNLKSNYQRRTKK